MPPGAVVEETPVQPPATEAPAPALEGLEVMIVEDDSGTLDFLCSALEQYGASVKTAASAEEALRILRSFWPNVLISDIAMPLEDGYSFIRNVRGMELQQGKRLPSIALTAYAGYEDRSRALSAGYHAHLAKPVDAARLATLVAEIAKK
jgi:CheY-like chemotaxis protein